ncbi:hypothetical protein PDPUS_1_01703 [Photobacterium damselae subsp. piscicida]|uniref:Uncharacterized protein n=1 Tax=Photobacterium damsela subsp. piscicida TaxID=38294 RepID=A0A1V1VC95_PHODP|nr:hypothetical protein [Photobacterium damselae]MBE8129189.1 hypothetical protein [Photobacterium damselae subsp. piscicida]MDP2514154.1 hypothetical protein [Photobacterium damselae subsp. piscicida]MDP2532711.1 hypothetical protein [Photobacterium damselae subsp. piscicida]MDP2544598.1 hypothetical protein [Photobacterium damselae subsp. piscicida]MDP2558761.1 hypothetical protein [Photobacterium damselae subsp. piscicida]
MDFVVPLATSTEQAEAVFSSIAQHVSAPSQAKRIHKIVWNHEGKKLPEVFRAEEKVLAIFDCGDVFKICTPNRGAIKFDPIHARVVTPIDLFSI